MPMRLIQSRGRLLFGWSPAGDGEPPAQVRGGFVRRGAIERHHRPGSAWGSSQLGSPLVAADVGDLDEELPPVDDFFKAMLYHGSKHAVNVG